MLKGFTTKQLIFITLISVLSVVFGYMFGVLNVITGIPLVAAVNGLIATILATYLFLIIRKTGVIFLFYLIHGVLIIPSPAIGPPGIYKLFVMILIALVIEIILLVFGKRIKLGVPVAMAIGLMLVPILTFYIASAMNVPNMEKTLPFLPPILATALVFGLLGSWLGFKLYNKLKNKRILRQISS